MTMVMAMAAREREGDTAGGGGGVGDNGGAAAANFCHQQDADKPQPQPAQTLHVHVDLGKGSRELAVTRKPDSAPNQEMKDPSHNAGHQTHHLSQIPSSLFCSNNEKYDTRSCQSQSQSPSQSQHGGHCVHDRVELPFQHVNMATDHLTGMPHLESGHSHPRMDDDMDVYISSDSQPPLPPSPPPPPPPPPAAPHHGHDQQQQQRPRQDSLASDWRFPSAASMHSPQSPRSPRSPGGYRPYTPGGPSSPLAPRAPAPAALALALIPNLSPAPVSNPRHDPWQAASGSGAASSPSSPATRRRRGVQLRQNTDPLVYHRLISSSPIQNTRTFSQGTSHSYQQSLPAQQHLFDPLLSSPTQLQHRHIASSPSRPAASTYHHHLPQQRFLPHDEDIFSDPADLNSPLAATFHLRQYDLAESHEPQHPANATANTSLTDHQYLPTSPVSPNRPSPLHSNPPSLRSQPSAQNRPTASSAASASASSADAAVTPTSSFPPSPIRSPKSPTFPGGQYPHPLIPEQGTARFDYESPQVPRHDRVDSLTASGQVDKMYRPDSRQSGDTAFGGGSENLNFSRPRKNSMRGSNRPDFAAMYLRPGTALSTASDSVRLDSHTMTSSFSNSSYAPYQPYNPSRPRRRPSASSNMSSSTFASVTPSMRHQASEDRLGGASRNVSQTAATGQFMGPPHIAHPQAPPRYYIRGGPPAPNQQSQLYEDEMRSSLRSHLTASTAQETLFTEPECSSVNTKTSSVFSSGFRNTRQSSFFGPHNPSPEVRDSLSVDDVMGMYENGFNDSDFDLARRMSGMELQRPEMPPLRLAPQAPDDYDNSRPGTAMSHHSTEAASRLLEAMSQTSPMPIPGRSFPLNGEGTKVLRDTNAFFRKSLASSLPKDMRLSFISTRSRMADEDDSADEEEAIHGEDDNAGHSRHDSGKMVGHRSDDDDDILIPDPEKEGADLISRAEIPEPPRDNGRLSPQPPPKSEPARSQPSPPQHIQGAAQPEDLDPNANDRYGFRKANQYITRDQYDEWNGQYSEYLARRRKKWEAFLKENGLITDRPTRFPQHSAKAKRFVRKGIPPDWRGAAWFYYAGGPKILAHNQGVYDDMLKRAKNGQLNEVCRDDIERDLYRTFPDNVRFRRTAAMQAQNAAGATPAHSRTNSTQSANPQPRPPGSEPEIIDQLRRVLSAFAVFNPNIGYCQSLNFLGGMLLLFVESEEHAFWLLNIITRVYLPGTHEMNLEGSKVDLTVLMAELQDVLPNVWTRISDDGSTVDKTRKKSRRHRNHHKTAPAANDLPPVTLALTAWFMSCFIGTLPVETTLRVWDVFFYEGSKTLFRVALAIFKAGENEIKAISDPMEVFAVVQSLPRKMVDANGLMDICFRRRNGLNHLTSELIDEQRADQKEKLHTERKEAMALATASPGLQSAATMVVNRKETDMLTVDSADGGRRKHTLFGRGRGH